MVLLECSEHTSSRSLRKRNPACFGQRIAISKVSRPSTTAVGHRSTVLLLVTDSVQLRTQSCSDPSLCISPTAPGRAIVAVRLGTALRQSDRAAPSSRGRSPVARFAFLIHSLGRGRYWRMAVVLDEISVALEARDAAINCLRSWRVDVGRDLFGVWTAEIRFGRIGRRGRAMRHRFDSEAEARSFLRARLRRRQGLVRRLGVRYRVVETSPTAVPLLALVGLLPASATADRSMDRRSPTASC
jgi:predicted DNA-binding WGR domain protein